MKFFEEPILEMEKFDVIDVITTSTADPTEAPGGGSGDNWSGGEW